MALFNDPVPVYTENYNDVLTILAHILSLTQDLYFSTKRLSALPNRHSTKLVKVNICLLALMDRTSSWDLSPMGICSKTRANFLSLDTDKNQSTVKMILVQSTQRNPLGMCQSVFSELRCLPAATPLLLVIIKQPLM